MGHTAIFLAAGVIRASHFLLTRVTSLAPMTNDSPNVKTIFGQALEIDSPERRSAYLDEACGGDGGLRADVESLLGALAQAGDFLEPANPAAVHSAAGSVIEGPGSVIGPYKLLQPIGEGGMGVVYMAQQQSPIRREVALKIIKPGMDTRQVIARFEAERQALALMNHPNIARILDAGVTETGRPYFVMDLVVGAPITEYCDANALPLRERLSLLVTACEAVQHAHRKGIIHRDLKPSNIMITLYDGVPVPKIIDFGIAKAVDRELTEKTLFTAYGQMVGTPQYMSPEQAEMSGLDVDTRADVYSLGVVLYELLTGTTPLEAQRLRSAGFGEMQRMIRDEEATSPSIRLTTLGEQATLVARHRNSDPKQLCRELSGELDWVVMKALDKVRTRRYESPADFARDIDRFLRHEPVTAGPPSLNYRLRKFIRRHRGPVVAGLLLFLTLIGGMIGTTIGMVRALDAEKAANDERDRALAAEQLAETERAAAVQARNTATAARKAVESAHRRTHSALLTLSNSGLGRLMGRQTVMGDEERFFLMRIEQFHRAFASAQGETEVSQANHADALLHVSRLRFQLGDWEGALRCAQRALDLYERLVAEYPQKPIHREGRASALNELGRAQARQGRLDDAAASHRAAVAICNELVAADGNNRTYRVEHGAAHHNWAEALSQLQQWPAAEAAFREAVTSRMRVLDDVPAAWQQRVSLTESLEGLARALFAQRRLDDAEGVYRQSLAALHPAIRGRPNIDPLRLARAKANVGLAAVLRSAGRNDDAESALEAALAEHKRLAAEFPTLPDYQIALASALRHLGTVRRSQGRLSEAENLHGEAVAIYEKVAEDPQSSPEHRRALGIALVDLANVLGDLSKYEQAREMLQRAASVLKTATAASRPYPGHERELRAAALARARTEIALGDHAAAARCIRKFTGYGSADPAEMSQAARRLFQCVSLVWQDPTRPIDERIRNSVIYSRRALNQFGKALVTEVQQRLEAAKAKK
jgi:serine/threonine protein kinase